MLTDLEELVLTCSDPRSRTYIQEAVNCYKAGAYRSAVVACWIAVAFDLIDKLRTIAATGDKAAEQWIEKFDRARQTNDLVVSLELERNLVADVCTKFEFISPLEKIDLERLRDDRNRCAHPSHVSDTQVFTVPPELARLHIVSSIRSVLSQEAAYGKSVLDRLLAELDGNSFPNRPAGIRTILESGPLCRPRESLFRNYVDILVKRTTSVEERYERRSRASEVLSVLKSMHPKAWEEQFPQVLKKAMRTRAHESEHLLAVVSWVGSKPGASLWSYFTPDDQLRIRTFVENMPGENIDLLEDIFAQKNHALYEVAVQRIRRAGADEIVDGGWFTLPEEAIDRLLRLYSHVRNFDEANKIGYALLDVIDYGVISDHQIHQILDVAAKNHQVLNSNSLRAMLVRMCERTNADVLNKELEARGLEWRLRNETGGAKVYRVSAL